ncbi:MAG TPA: hypothetical protein VJC10_00390 [Patescibacteria group bacterium]|nr:hypothetical protein [Patescibacteria group bacterium]
MNNLLERTKGFRLLFIFAFIIILIFLILIVFAIRQPQSSSTTPQPNVSFQQGEVAFPEATPQPFYNSEKDETGSLVVTSDLEKVRVMIDNAEVESQKVNVRYPIQITPFRISSVPIGKHVLSGAKKGYVFEVISFTIRPNEVTRVNIKLKPL